MLQVKKRPTKVSPVASPQTAEERVNALERRLAGKLAALQNNYNILQAMGNKLHDGGVSLTRANDKLQKEVENLQVELTDARGRLSGAATSGGGLLEAAVQESGVADMVEVVEAAAPQNSYTLLQESGDTMQDVGMSITLTDEEMQKLAVSLQGKLSEAEGGLPGAATDGGGQLEAAVLQGGMVDIVVDMGGGVTTSSL